jgi:hypothetical protein
MQGRYCRFCDQPGMMQNLRSDWIIEQVNEVSIGIGRQHFRWQVMEDSADADGALTDAEILDQLSRSLQQDQSQIRRYVCGQVGEGQSHEVHPGRIEVEQQLNQARLTVYGVD